MKKLLLALSLMVLAVASQAQFEKHVVNGISGYYLTAGQPMGFILHRAADKSRKQPIIIHLSGIGEITKPAGSTAPLWDTTTANGLAKLYQSGTGMPYWFSTSTSSMSVKKFHIPNSDVSDSVQFYLIAPQCSGRYGYWIRGYVATMIAWIKTNLATEVDTNRIYLAGLSMGGGGGLIAAANPSVNAQIAAMMINCPGYSMPLSSGDHDGTDYKMLARSGLPMWFAQAKDDCVCAGGTDTIVGLQPRDGTKHMQEAIDSLTKWKCLVPFKYFKYTSGGHGIWDRAYNPATASTNWPVTNGYNVNYTFSIYDWFLSYTNVGSRAPESLP